MTEENCLRLIFRPTRQQYNELQQLYATGRYKHLSELLRDALHRGAMDIKKEIIEEKKYVDYKQ